MPPKLRGARAIAKQRRALLQSRAAKEEHKLAKWRATTFGRLPLDCTAEICGFLEANDQAKLRRTSKYFCTVFNHAFQRGYVAAAIHQGYVDKLDAMHEDGDDGHPLLRVAPVDPKQLFQRIWNQRMHRSEKDNDATLFVNVRLVLGSGKTVLGGRFLQETSFKAVHLYGTETVEKIENNFLTSAKVQTLTMTTPCPKLREVGNYWLQCCDSLTHFDISGCCALERMGNLWLNCCAALESLSFKGCRQLKHVGNWWMSDCRNLSSVDLGDLVVLEEVAGNWLKNSCSLASIDFSTCRALRAVDKEWLHGCSALETIDVRGCVAMEYVGEGFLEYSGSIQRILVSKDQKLHSRLTRRFGEKCVVD